MLLITGTGRSGTSVLAKYCLVMGNDPGGRWKDEADAGFEDDNAVAITRIFDKRGKGDGFGLARMQPVNRAVVKVPHLIVLGKIEILDYWAELKPDLRLLIAWRPFESVGRSFAARPEIFKRGTDADAIAKESRRNFSRFVTRVMEKKLPYQIVPMLVDSTRFEDVYQALTVIGGLKLEFSPHIAEQLGLQVQDQTPKGVWEAVYKPDMKHH